VALVRRAAQAAEWLGRVRHAVPHEDWPTSWRELARGLEALAEHRWLQ
jgi:hypothetical protein